MMPEFSSPEWSSVGGKFTGEAEYDAFRPDYGPQS